MTDLPPGAGAAQLALLRLLAEDGRGPVDDGLARLVLTTAATGRGRVDLSAATEHVPVAELQRVATGVLAHLVDRYDAPELPTGPHPSRFFARRFRLYGSPGAVTHARNALARPRLGEGDYRATHVVLVLPLELMVREHWISLVSTGSGRSWRRLWRMLQRTDRIPRRVDPVALADGLRAAGRKVEVVVAPERAQVVAGAGSVLGVRTSGVPDDPDPAVVDVRRRVNIVRATAVPPFVLEDWCRTAPGPPLAAPPVARTWLASRADRLAERLAERQRAGHYPVHGDPAVVSRTLDGDVRRRIDPAQTLAATVAGIRAGWHRVQAEEV